MKRLYIFIFLLFSIKTFAQNYTYQPSIATNPFAQPQFVPNISLIADISYVKRNIEDKEYKSLEIPYFIHGLIDEHGHGHSPMNSNNGFNLNYGELAIESVVDPYMNLIGIFHIAEDNLSIEELYFTTRSLPYNLQVKGGKFLSSIGRINLQHQHYWDFADIPLIYKVFFGDEGLNEKGIQLTWVAPTPFYLLFGTEIFQGENELSFGYEEIEDNTNKIFDKTSIPNLYTTFIKSSYDIGNLTILGGISFLSGKFRFNHLEDVENPHAAGGNTKIYGLNFISKYFLDSHRYISIQGEFFYRNLDGKLYKGGSYLNLEKKQAGYYGQIIYRINQRWKTGLRYENLNKNEVNGINYIKNLDKYSFVLDFTPSEWTKIRFQYNYDKSKFIEDKRKNINEFIFEINLAIGAHGAHKF